MKEPTRADMARRLLWVHRVFEVPLSPGKTVLRETFEDLEKLKTHWSLHPGRYTSWIADGKLDIDVNLLVRDCLQQRNCGPCGMRSRKTFKAPLRVSVDLEMTRLSPGLVAAVKFHNPNPAEGQATHIRVELRGFEYAISREHTLLIQSTLTGAPIPHRERWQVEVYPNGLVRLLVKGKEVLRQIIPNFWTEHRIEINSNFPRDVPDGTRVRYDNLLIEQIENTPPGR